MMNITRLRLLPYLIGFALPGLAGAVVLGWPIWVSWVVGGSLSTFVIFGWDKFCAKRNASRTPEVVLLALTALGGSPGGLLGMLLFGHKTRKGSFLVAFGFCVAVSVAVVYGVWRWLG